LNSAVFGQIWTERSHSSSQGQALVSRSGSRLRMRKGLTRACCERFWKLQYAFDWTIGVWKGAILENNPELSSSSNEMDERGSKPR